MTTFVFRPADDEGEHSASEAPPGPPWHTGDRVISTTSAHARVGTVAQDQEAPDTVSVLWDGAALAETWWATSLCPAPGSASPPAPPPDDALAEAKRWDAARAALAAYVVARQVAALSGKQYRLDCERRSAAEAAVRRAVDACSGDWPIVFGDLLLDVSDEGDLTATTVRRL